MKVRGNALCDRCGDLTTVAVLKAIDDDSTFSVCRGCAKRAARTLRKLAEVADAAARVSATPPTKERTESHCDALGDECETCGGEGGRTREDGEDLGLCPTCRGYGVIARATLATSPVPADQRPVRSAREVVHEAARGARLPWCPKTKHYIACDTFTAMLEQDRASRGVPAPTNPKVRPAREVFCPPSEMEADELMYAAAEWMDDSEAMYREGKPVSTWPELTAALRAYAAVIEADRASRSPRDGEGTAGLLASELPAEAAASPPSPGTPGTGSGT